MDINLTKSHTNKLNIDKLRDSLNRYKLQSYGECKKYFNISILFENKALGYLSRLAEDMALYRMIYIQKVNRILNTLKLLD